MGGISDKNFCALGRLFGPLTSARFRYIFFTVNWVSSAMKQALSALNHEELNRKGNSHEDTA